MFIHSLTIENFRNFGKSEIFFNEGTNVIIGPNNAGKTNVFKALGLIFDPNSNRKLDVDDFYKGIDTKEYFGFNKTTGKLIKQSPPNIIISATIVESTGENKDKELLHDDKNTVYDWLVQMEPFYQAKLTYKFFLPDDENCKKYEDAVLDLIKKGKTSADDYWRMVKRKFIRKFVVRIYGGFAEQEKRADTDSLNRFDFQFLNALRDAERHLFTGQNTLLKEVLNYFLDDDLKNSQNLNEEEKLQKIDERNEDFSDRAVAFINLVKERINEEPILKYSRDVGASLGGEPTFQGETTEVELFSALKLIVQNHLLGINLPATHNGLGYSNLIFISILLAKMQMSASNYGNEDEKKVFPMLLIEEPEAHLHPAMQFKLLKFLKEKVKENTQVRQVFVTTHSTQITSAVDLDEIICLNQAEKGKVKIAYPGKVFRSDCEEDQKSKAYVKRFLDATNSDMLFAKSVIFVEGITEQLLFSLLAEYKNISLEDNHVSVINIGGRYFNHFLKLFDYDENNSFKKNAIIKKVACVTDADPTRKEANKEKSKFNKCFPYQLNLELSNFEYQKVSQNLTTLDQTYCGKQKIGIFARRDGRGKTFEYDFMFENPNCQLLLTEGISKKEEILNLMKAYEENKPFEDFLQLLSSLDREKKDIEISDWPEDEKKKAIIASRYLKSVENSKGEFALEISLKLKQNLIEKSEDFNLPNHIHEAIDFICGE